MTSVRRCVAVAVIGFALVILSVSTAHAATFYWYRIKVKTDNEPRCREYAGTVMKRKAMRNVRADNLAVSGNTATSSAIITCFQFGADKPAMAVIMVWGDAPEQTRQLSVDLKNDLEQFQTFNL